MKKVIEYKNNMTSTAQNCLYDKDILFLPDRGYRSNYFVPFLTCELASMSIADMPNVYDFNTKRYESLWMQYMRETLSLDKRDIVIAHGTSADAMLRYMETDVVQCAILIDPSHIYTAGERHGRAYRYEVMKRNFKYIALLATTEVTKYLLIFCTVYTLFLTLFYRYSYFVAGNERRCRDYSKRCQVTGGSCSLLSLYE
jgi:hypothetical protein